MKKEKIILFAILVTAIILRILCLDKNGGLWYDEIVSYKEAVKINAISVIYYTLKTDVHLPLYQLFLHYWGKIFSFADISLRGFSAICGIFAVAFAYFTGKELNSKKTGLFCAGMFAVNSFLIYYSQEVRMYSFLMLLSVMQLFFITRIKSYGTKLDYFMFTILSIGLIYTQTIGFIYITAVITAFLVYLAIKKDSEKVKGIIKSSIMIFVLSLPLILYMLIYSVNYTEQINGYYCDWSTLFVVMQDIFTPVLIGISSNPVHYMHELFTTLSLSKIFFIITPLCISGYCIYTAIKKDKFSFVILLSALAFFSAEIIAFKATNFKIMSRYLSIIVPNLLILTGYGLSLINHKKHLQIILVNALLIINLSYLIFSPNAAFKLPRNGFKPLASAINKSDIHPGDFIVVWNRKEILDKYVKEKINVLSILKDFSYRSEVILNNEQKLNSMPLDERKRLLRAYFSNNEIPHNTIYLMNFIITNMKNGQKFIITTTEYFDKFSADELKNLSTDDGAYSEISYNSLLTIKSLLDIKFICSKELKLIKKEKINGYVMYVYEK